MSRDPEQKERTGPAHDNGVHDQDDWTVVSPHDLDAQASKYDKNSQAAKQWLLSFGHLKSGTEVSLHFKLEPDVYPESAPYSLLPVLSRWLRLWFVKSLSDSYERTITSWLLDYIADYVELGHSELDHDELEALCDELLYVCSNARHHSHIERCLNVFLAITKCGWFPEESLSEVLTVLCSATVILERPLARIDECVLLLASGSIAHEAVSVLFLQLSAVRDKQRQEQASKFDIHKYLTPARGASRHLMSLLTVKGRDNKYVVDIESLILCLQKASQAQLIRLSTEILDLCTAVLQSPRKDDLRTDEQLAIFINIIQNCADASIVTDTNDAALINATSKEEPQKRERRYRRDHDASLADLIATITNEIYTWTKDRQRQLYRVYHLSTYRLRAPGVAFMLYMARTEALLLPGTEDWDTELGLFLSSFVQREDLDEQSRIAVLDFCTDIIAKASGNNDGNSLEVGRAAVLKILALFPRDHSEEVIRAAMQSVSRLATCVTADGEAAFAHIIIDTLHTSIMKFGGTPGISDTSMIEGARAIRRTLVKSPLASISSSAFEALVNIASLKCKSRLSRLAAMRILTRLRCDVNGSAYLDVSSISMHIASALCRTEESRNHVFQDMSTTSLALSSTSTSQSTSDGQLWSYPDELDEELYSWKNSELIGISIKDKATSPESKEHLRITEWLFVAIQILLSDSDWETYSFMIVHIADQIVNMKLFSGSLEAMVQLRKILCEQIRTGSFTEPPRDTGLKRSDVALCIYHILCGLIPYSKIQSPHIQAEGFGNDLVRAFVSGIAGQYEGTARGCIHALSLCCFETPESIASEYPSILDKLSKSMTQSHLVVHILEFLAQVARLPELHGNFSGDEIRVIFGMCIQYTEKTREKTSHVENLPQRSITPARHVGLSLRRPPYRAAMMQEKGLPQYSSALAYHTMIFWFLSLNLQTRSRIIPFVVPRLIWRNSNHEDMMDEQSEVLVDMMQRTAYSDLGETRRPEMWANEEDGPIRSASWIVGLSIVTVETAGHTGKSLITKRQAAGTTHSILSLQTAILPPHHAPSWTEISSTSDRSVRVLPSHVFLQMVASAAATSIAGQPVLLPQEDYVRRGLEAIDRCPTVDSHKVGVLNIQPGQEMESEYLANTADSVDFDAFLSRLGVEVSLTPPLQFNAQGLHHESDGDMTIAWRDRVNEVIYLVPKFMPNPEDDPHLIRKKSLVGNCHVVVVFNQSNQAWKMEKFASQVTMCHIVITPVDREVGDGSVEETEHDFFQVEVLTKEAYQNISAAAERKVVSKTTLAPFVRMIALNANIFSMSQVAADAGDDEFPSTWRERLKGIKRLKQQTQARVLEPRQDTLSQRHDFQRWT